jgi:hypothetical protein
MFTAGIERFHFTRLQAPSKAALKYFLLMKDVRRKGRFRLFLRRTSGSCDQISRSFSLR